MLQIDLATLSASELRRLVEVAKSRGQDALAAKLSAELVARRRIRAPGPAAEPQRMSFDREAWASAAPAAQARVRRGPPFAALAATGLLALALGWGTSLQLAPHAEPTVRLTYARPARIMLARTEPTVVTPTPAASELAAQAAPVAAPEAPKANPCYDLPTPGERLVCGYPSLAQQDRALVAAYDRAMASAADPETLERDQAGWRAARNGVSDRTRLAEMYAERIHELEAGPTP